MFILNKLVFSSRERSEQSLVRWATPQLHDIDLLAKMVDPALDGMYPAKSLSRFADIIAICVQVRSVHVTAYCHIVHLIAASKCEHQSEQPQPPPLPVSL
jgi:hypothetical protein